MMERPFLTLKTFAVNPDGHVLLLRRTGKDYWDLPGGRLEEGEDPMLAFAREFKEETGCILPDVSSLDVLWMGRWMLTTGIPIVAIVQLVHVSGECPVMSDEHEAFVWFDVNEPEMKGLSVSAKAALEAYKGR